MSEQTRQVIDHYLKAANKRPGEFLFQKRSGCAVADDGEEGVEHIECGERHPAFNDAPSVDELRHR